MDSTTLTNFVRAYSVGVRVHATSRGLDPTTLRPGEDVVLDMPAVHGPDLPDGVLAHDHLAPRTRVAVDTTTVAAFQAWYSAHRSRLTIDGIDLAWIHELETVQILAPLIAQAAGLRAAVRAHRPAALVVIAGDEQLIVLVRCVAAAERIPVRERTADPIIDAHAATPPSAQDDPRASSGHGRPAARRVGRAALAAALSVGVPTVLRRDAVLLFPYWTLMPTLDRMIERGHPRPAITLWKRPTSPRRSLAAARRGGWIAPPGPRDRRRAQRDVVAALRRCGDPALIEASGMDIGHVVHPLILDHLRRRAPGTIATAAVLRRAFARGHVRAVLSAWDINEEARLVVSLAREAGIRTIAHAHGAYLFPQIVVDLEVADEIALWSHAVAPPFSARGRMVHVVGYPSAVDPPLPTRSAPTASQGLRVVVTEQSDVPVTAVVDPRSPARHWEAAVRALAERLPGASVVLRPHPSTGLALGDALRVRFPSMQIEQDHATEILELLRGCDLVVGGLSTATLQAALVGAPVIVLNVTGHEWRPPCGGQTTVPVARSTAELQELLDCWAAGPGPLPGREALLGALGVDHDDASERLLEILG